MANLPSSFVKVNDVEVSQDTPVTESLFAKLGSNDNYLKDNLDAEITNRGTAITAAVLTETNNRVAADSAINVRIGAIGTHPRLVTQGNFIVSYPFPGIDDSYRVSGVMCFQKVDDLRLHVGVTVIPNVTTLSDSDQGTPLSTYYFSKVASPAVNYSTNYYATGSYNVVGRVLYYQIWENHTA